MEIEHDLMKDMRGRNTLVFLLLSVVTLYLYLGHFITRKTRALNRHLEPQHHLPMTFARTLLALTYVQSLTWMGSEFLYIGNERWLMTFSNAVGVAWIGLVIFWALMVRTRMNYLLRARRRDKKYISVMGIALFSVWYLNFKMNRISRLLAREAAKGVGEMGEASS